VSPAGRTLVALAVLSAIAVVVVGLIVAGIVPQRGSAVDEPQARPAPSSTALATTAAAASVLSDRFGFAWVDERSRRLLVRPETGRGGFEIAEGSYGFSSCSCAVSPDGTRIAFWTNLTPGVELRVVEVARPIQPATIYRAPDDRRISTAAWSSDGSGILFSLEGVSPPGGPVGNPPNTSLLVIEAGGGTARTLIGGAAGSPVYVPLGWDRAANVAAAGESGEGGYMRGYVTVRTAGDPAPQRTYIAEDIVMFSVDVSIDQRYALGLFSGPSGNTLRWWRLADYGTIQNGPRLDHAVRAKWRPSTNEFAWIEGADLRLMDVGRGTTRAGGALPQTGYSLAAFRRDGSAAIASFGSGSSTLLLELASGQSEPIGAPGYAAGSVLFTAGPSLNQPSSPAGTQPPLNGLEVKVIDALRTLGITGQRAQLPSRDAAIWADLGRGSALFVNAYPLGTADRNYTVIDERQLAGIKVQHVRRPSSADGTMSTRFECSREEYWVGGAVPPGFADMDAFVERFIRALACSR
jgi:hypothetical protein